MSDTTPTSLPGTGLALPQVTEDAAGEGGDAIATFSNYIAPLWAQHCGNDNGNDNDSGNGDVTTGSMKSSEKTQNTVIKIDFSDNDDKQPASSINTEQQKQPSASQSILSHSSPACESGLLASVSAPKPKEECLTIIRQLAKEGKLSPLQVEGAGLAIQRHCRLFQCSSIACSATKDIGSVNENGRSAISPGSSDTRNRRRSNFVRAGFFLGDGAGIGKGRQIAAVLKDSLSRSFIQTNDPSTTSTTANSSSTPPSSSKSSRFSKKRTLSKRRHLWLSVSRELIEDARRDLKDIECHIPVIDGAESLVSSSNNSNGGSGKLFSSSHQQSGILFVTYALLVSGKGKRLNDIIQWLTYGSTEETFDGCIIFDEAHKAKNLCQEPPTTTGVLVLELQERLRNARVMYCSATGVSDLKQLGYATRLGLWGAGTNYPSFESFRASFEKKGVGAMEMLALEMKQSGSFVARTLSWDGAEFESIKVKLSKEQIFIYNQSMKWWDNVKVEINAALRRPDMNGTPKMLWSQYWSAHQRFSKELAICAKVPFVVSDAKSQLEMGNSVVIGLQSTGEAATQAALEEIKSVAQINKSQDLDELPLTEIISTASAIMAGFVRNYFPVAPLPPDPIKVPPTPPHGFTNDHDRMVHQQMKMIAEEQKLLSPPEAIPELLLKKQNLLNAIKAINLPPCPLDDLIDQLGGVKNVAEMTGRSGRIIRSSAKSTFNFVRRISMPKENKYALSLPPSQEDSDRLNIVEKRKFMDGRKQVAIISDAASTGISLHSASNSTACERRRVHYTIELPWAADKAIQQLGRTHRSGQITAPIYKMVVTDLGGERRFAAAVAKRMASLGALTKGDRRAASGSDLSEFDVDSRFGRRSLKRLLDCMAPDPPYMPSKGSNALLNLYILNSDDALLRAKGQLDRWQFALRKAKASLEAIGIDASSDTRKNNSVKVFLNRIAALTVAEQNLVFGLFTSTMDDVIAEARATGEWEGSVEQIRATSIELSAPPQVIAHDNSNSNTGASTKLITFDVDRGMTFAGVCRICHEIIVTQFSKANQVEVETSVAQSGFYVSKRLIMGRTLILFAKRKVNLTPNDELDNIYDYDPRGLMVLTRPNTGTNSCEMPTSDLYNKYRLVASVNDLKNLITEKTYIDPAAFSSLVREKYNICFALWHQTFNISNTFNDQIGLAPRWSKLAMVTGSVLHCLPALQKSVSTMTKADRSLKIIRVETSSSNQQYVGMKFPVDDKALCSLIAILHTVRNSSSVVYVVDELPSDIQPKSVAWVTTEPTTMKNFFKPINVELKRKSPSASNNATSKVRRTETKIHSTTKKSKSTITSFFQKL